MWGLLAPTPLGSVGRSIPADAPCGHVGNGRAAGRAGMQGRGVSRVAGKRCAVACSVRPPAPGSRPTRGGWTLDPGLVRFGPAPGSRRTRGGWTSDPGLVRFGPAPGSRRTRGEWTSDPPQVQGRPGATSRRTRAAWRSRPLQNAYPRARGASTLRPAGPPSRAACRAPRAPKAPLRTVHRSPLTVHAAQPHARGASLPPLARERLLVAYYGHSR